jgi:hypothetical protein
VLWLFTALQGVRREAQLTPLLLKTTRERISPK